MFFTINYFFYFVVVPRGGPHIQGYDREVKIGDKISLNCTSLKSKPAAKLSFFINKKKVKEYKNFNASTADAFLRYINHGLFI